MENKTGQRSNILYVDDIDTNLVLFEASFSKHFNVSLATSGKEALALLRKQEFAVIITDQSMPGMSGTELLEVTKTEFPDTMRFILTAYSDYGTVVDSINKGEIYGFFNKPFDPEVVRIALNKAIEVYNLRISNRRMIKELEKANSQLLNIDKSKTRYLNIITNEIRTPINKIMSAVHMLKDRIGSNDLNELLFYLDTSVSRLESFSFAANQLARLNEDSATALDFKSVSLRELIEVCILENKNVLDKFGTRLEIDDKMPDINVMGEYELLMACLTTLLLNSSGHIDKAGSIGVSCGENEEGKFLEITDKGSNYSTKQIENIISFFINGENISDFTPGIELILAKQTMISHGGKVTIKRTEDKTLSTKMVFPASN